MSASPDPERARHADLADGAYESYFIRANHPERPLGFWVRYTLFRPRGRPQDAIGELWSILFDADRGRHIAIRRQFPWSQCAFSPEALDVRVPGAALTANAASGEIPDKIAWTVRMTGEAPPIFLLPERFYEGRFPAAKSLVVKPSCRFDGEIVVEGERIPVEGWTGSLNHNWGSRHTDRYAWGQVSGFDGHPETFLEIASAWLKIGPLSAPPMTPMVLRHKGETIAINGLLQAARANVSLSGYEWRFTARNPTWEIDGKISADPKHFVGLAYANPPGGVKHCLNSKIARCEVSLRNRSTGAMEALVAANRAAFEILTDPHAHGVPIVAGYGVP